MRFLSLDPGELTGWSLWEMFADSPLRNLDHGTIHGGLSGFCAWWREAPKDWDFIVAESFVLDGRTPKPNVTPLRIEGALHMAWAPMPIVFQRNTQKAQAPDDLLKRNGLWWTGEGHDRDSARHAIAYARNIVHIPTLEWLHPRRKECK